MKISSITDGGVIAVRAYTHDGVFALLHRVDVSFEDGAFLRVPSGFVFDGASIPSRARSIIASLSTAGSVAFVIHDYAYALGATWINAAGRITPICRKRADWIALALCTWLDLDADDSVEIYAALRLAGGSSYGQLPVERTVEQMMQQL